MREFYKNLTLILLATFLVVGPIVFFAYRASPATQPGSPSDQPPGTATERGFPPASVKILALGDVMLGRAVLTVLNKNSRDYLFKNAGELFSDNDLAWANLEGPVLYNPPETPINGMSFAFQTNSLEALRGAGIGFLNLANNHGLDQGRSGLDESREILRSAGFVYMGDPAKIGPESLATTTINGVRLAFLGFNATWNTFKLDEAVKLVRESKNYSDFALVMIHWGEEYKLIHNPEQEKIAHALIDAGGDVIFGHHPHVVQDIEKYSGKYIFYSLGNLVFDQWFSRETQEGLAVRTTIKDGEISHELLPYRTQKSAVYVLNEKERATWLADFTKRNISSPQDALISGTLN